jgi:predicted nucleic acid-binding protein
MKIMTCFIDGSAWIAITDQSNVNHESAKEYFKSLLENNTKLVTNNLAIDEAIIWFKKNMSADVAKNFLNTLDESILTVNLRMDWISRRVRRAGLNNYFKSKDSDLSLKHFLIYESIKRKRVDILFSFDHKYKAFGIPLMPQLV